MSAEAEIAKVAGKALLKLLGKPLKTDKWALRGTYTAEPTDKKGVYTIIVPEDDPLRLVHLASGRAIVIPWARFESDFASVPAMVRALCGKASVLHLGPRDYEEAAVLHDGFYAAGWCWSVRTAERDGKRVVEAVRMPLEKREADAALYVGMECKGATVADGISYHAGVAMFGGKRWDRGIEEGKAAVESGRWAEMWADRPMAASRRRAEGA